MIEIILILFGIIVLMGIGIYLLVKDNITKKEELETIKFNKSSQSVKYGKMTEQWIPFSTKFPYNSEKFRFLGNPIDGIVFDENEIVFVEFKTNTSQLNQKQKEIKELILNKKVKWDEFRIN